MRLIPDGSTCSAKRRTNSTPSSFTMHLPPCASARTRQATCCVSIRTMRSFEIAVRWVARQVRQHLRRPAHGGLGVHHPVVLKELAAKPDPVTLGALWVARHGMTLPRVFQCRDELAPKHPRQGVYREQERRRPTRNLPLPVGRERAARHHVLMTLAKSFKNPSSEVDIKVNVMRATHVIRSHSAHR